MTPTNPTTNARAILRGITLAFACSAGCLAYGQTAVSTPTPAPSAAPAPVTLNEDQAVELPKFEITTDSGNRYQSQQALSASRVATAIIDIPQTISVIPKELIEDTKGNRMLDVAKYVTPVQESTLAYGSDRYTIRGFAVSAEFVDGTNISGAEGYSMSQMPYNIERLEVIKGPNSILVPGGSPGGVINPITKSPTGNNTGSVSVDFSPILGRDVWFDVNRVLSADGKMAARLVAAYWDSDLYFKNQYRKGFEISPSFSYQISPNHKLIVKGDFVLNRETNLGGVPIDPSVGSGQYARIATGLPRDWSFGNEIDSRKRKTQRITMELLSTLNDHVTSRLQFMADHVWRCDIGGTTAGLPTTPVGQTYTAGQSGGGSVNPSTGRYEPGVNWNTTQYNNDTTGTVALTGTAIPVTDWTTWIYTRNTTSKGIWTFDEFHLKNDYAAQFNPKWAKSTTIWGFAANSSRVHVQGWTGAGPRPSLAANNLGSITYPGYSFNPITPGSSTAGLGTDKTALQVDVQAFLYESLSMWKDRIQVSGGLSRFFGNLSRTDTTGTAAYTVPNSSPAVVNPSYSTSSTATSFGVVLKPIKQVGLFYSRNTTGNTLPASINGSGATAPNLPLAVGAQNEFGVKTSFLNGKFTTSFAHFDIAQQNVQVTNSEYYRLMSLGDAVSIAAANALTPLYLDMKSKGWEFEATYSMSKSLTLLGNFTSYKVRQPITDTRVRGVPDRSYGAYADYRFVAGALKGFGVNFGIDYKSDVAGDNASGFTVIRGGTPVPVQPTFLIAGRTIANLGFTYKYSNWAASITVMNLFDEDYVMSATSRGNVVMGTPRTLKSTISYTF